MKDLFTIRGGYTPSKNDPTLWADGTVPWFRMEDIRENGRTLSHSLQSVNEKAVKKNGTFPANSLLVATSATIGEHALVTVPHLANQRFVSLCPKDEYAGKLDMQFAHYYTYKLDKWCLDNTTTSSFPSVNMSGFKEFEFPLPPIEVQKEIAAKLDKMESLTTSLREGLPAEITLRRKQYGYYRDKLLTFPVKESV